MGSKPGIFIEGKTIRQLAEESGQSEKTIRTRYLNPNVPNTIAGLTSCGKYSAGLGDATLAEWAREISKAIGRRILYSTFYSFVAYQRDKGMSDKEVIKAALKHYGVDYEQIRKRSKDSSNRKGDEGETSPGPGPQNGQGRHLPSLR